MTNVGKKELYTAIKDMNYGEKFVAVYVPITLQEIKSPRPESDSTEILDKTHGKKQCYYLMSGGGEIVIPERCFHLVKVVSLKKQLFEYDRKITYMKDGWLKTASGKTIIPARKVGGRRIKYPRKYFK